MSALDGAPIVLLLILVLAASIAEKARWLKNGAAEWHPLLLGLPSSRATTALSLSACVDAVAVLLLVLEPWAGAVLTIGLLILYTVVALGRSEVRVGNQLCGCFGRFLDVRGGTRLVFRNTVLLAGAILLILFSSGSGSFALASIYALVATCLLLVLARSSSGVSGLHS